MEVCAGCGRPYPPAEMGFAEDGAYRCGVCIALHNDADALTGPA